MNYWVDDDSGLRGYPTMAQVVRDNYRHRFQEENTPRAAYLIARLAAKAVLCEVEAKAQRLASARKTLDAVLSEDILREEPSP